MGKTSIFFRFLFDFFGTISFLVARSANFEGSFNLGKESSITQGEALRIKWV